MKRLIVLCLAATALAGCDKLPFGKLEAPHRKPGLWQQTLVADGRPAIVTKVCYDAATDRRMPVFGPRQRSGGGGGGFTPNCSKNDRTKQGDTYVADRDCTLPNGIQIASHSVLSGDFQSSYTARTETTISGAPDPARNGHHVSVLTATFQGDCPPDIQPGQVQLPNGDVVDLAQLRNGFGGGGFGGGRQGGGGGGASNAAPSSNSAPASGN